MFVICLLRETQRTQMNGMNERENIYVHMKEGSVLPRYQLFQILFIDTMQPQNKILGSYFMIIDKLILEICGQIKNTG